MLATSKESTVGRSVTTLAKSVGGVGVEATIAAGWEETRAGAVARAELSGETAVAKTIAVGWVNWGLAAVEGYSTLGVLNSFRRSIESTAAIAVALLTVIRAGRAVGAAQHNARTSVATDH